MPDPKIYVDMDEVLVDFIGAACKAHGTTFAELEPNWPPGTWQMDEVMGISLDMWWAPIHSLGEKFWKEIEPLPWFNDILDWVQSTTDDWHIVSTPSNHASSWSGKKKWWDKHAPQHSKRLILCCDKANQIESNGILIDDNEETCHKYQARGGTAILFPIIGNRLHALRHNPLEIVRTKVNELVT
jgi:5'(3')-deoxyribonucleotidase